MSELIWFTVGFVSVLLIIMNIGVYFINVKAGTLVSFFVAAYIVIAVILYFHSRPILLNDLISCGRRSPQRPQSRPRFTRELWCVSADSPADRREGWGGAGGGRSWPSPEGTSLIRGNSTL